MKNKDLLDYNAYYDSIFSSENEGKINASDFIDYFAGLIIKHSVTLEKKFSQKGETK